ncbi:hypothetical protein HF325_000858 [Metschnikowia pulcherrima]|uniref:SIS domain-containing protein n=1 Tax=Metschnikowia pulcherrima TaxID=27326 RepID=A0A8H7GZE9_9ASCO|nr:hypothetical protein HF325_000858 [Metschnikowia pulcherrima]
MSTAVMSAPEWQKLTFAALQSVKTTLGRESEALRNLAAHYVENIDTQLDMINSIGLLYDAHKKGGKIVCCGIGKSYKIATKTVATLKSLTINADELHPSEALHGDLGLLRENDCLIFFTASGNTPELIQLLPHISPNIPIVLLTCSKQSKLASHPQSDSLPIHGSYTSLLSLDQFRECFRTTSATSTAAESAVDDSQMVKSNFEFSLALMNARSDSCLKTKKAEFLGWSELDFLKNLALYDYIMFESGAKSFAADSSKLRSMYKDVSGLPVGFTGMADFTSLFREIDSPSGC